MTGQQIRVRFAPSPTGFLHVGGARTALFNWLFAKRHGGVFVLRIEDTDAQRGREDLIGVILDGLSWLGLRWDEGPHLQSGFRSEHVATADRLLASARAYRCFCDQAEIEAKRERAASSGETYRYDRTCWAMGAEGRARREAAGEPSCVRLLVPDGAVGWEDLVHGPVSFDSGAIEDLVLLRSDGSPTYNLACVADDAAMRITHVIRGDDHISNTPKQILIYRALGLAEPRFGHLPLILGEDKKRLSKRHGAVSVTEYRRAGYLPEALFNFLALLGWSPGGDRELMSREEIVESFSFDGVNPRSAVFDHAKLDWMNGQYLARMPAAELAPAVIEALAADGLRPWDGADDGRFLRLVDALKIRCRRIPEIARDMRPYLTEEFEFEPEAARKHLSGPETASRLEALAAALAALPSFDEKAAEEATRGLAASLGVGAAKVIHPARVAITGRAASPGIFEVMVLVGREGTLARLRRAVEWIRRGGASEP